MRKAGKDMDKLMKFIPVAVAVGVAACIAIGIAIVGMKKESDISEVATTQQIIQVQDNTATSSNREIFKTEAENLWKLNGDKLICEKDKFIEEYIAYRESGLTESKAYDSLYNSYAKEFQAETNGDGEVVAEGFDAANVIDNNVEEPTVKEEETTAPAEEKVQFTVEELTPVKMYATEAVNLRQGPSSSDFGKVGSLNKGDCVTVVGIVKTYKGATTLWYKLDNGQFVSGAYLSDKQPEQPTTSAPQQPQTQPQTEPATQKQEQQTTAKQEGNKVIINGVEEELGFGDGSDGEIQEKPTEDYELPTGNVIGN